MRMKLIPLVSRSWQGHGVVGAVGAKDWAGGFLDLKADLQSSTFVGNEPLTVESRAGYLGKYFFFFFFAGFFQVWGTRESLTLTFKIIMKAMKQQYEEVQFKHGHNSVPFFFNSPLSVCQRRQWHPTPVLLPGKSHG